MDKSNCPKCGSDARNARGECIACKRAYLAAWRIVNRDKLNADRLRWNRENSERAKANLTRWREENAQGVSDYMREWSASNPEKRRANEATRRERMGDDKLPETIKMDLYITQGGRCAICNGGLDNDFELDHVVPLAKGGRNVAHNVQLTHPKCNRRKGVSLFAILTGGAK